MTGTTFIWLKCFFFMFQKKKINCQINYQVICASFDFITELHFYIDKIKFTSHKIYEWNFSIFSKGVLQTRQILNIFNLYLKIKSLPEISYIQNRTSKNLPVYVQVCIIVLLSNDLRLVDTFAVLQVILCPFYLLYF